MASKASNLAGFVTSISPVNNLTVGIVTASSVSINSTQVISSGRQLQNITSLDATTTATIESAVSAAPNDFSSLYVSGISTLGYSSGVGTVRVGNGSTALTVEGNTRVTGSIQVGVITATDIDATTIDATTIAATTITATQFIGVPASFNELDAALFN